ncbi:hypothetical protein BDV19DRAFT_386697 [Aspergillus venezuelensis]
MYALVANSFKTTPSVRRILPCAYYHPQANLFQSPPVHSTAHVDQFYMSSSYPDDADTPPSMTQRRTSVHATPSWAETNATQSEADVKADRGEAADPEELSQYEEPKIDEM